MIQKMTIDIESTKPLSAYGSGHTLVYDEDKNHYFIVTREEFLKVQNDKIKNLNEKFYKLENLFKMFTNEINNNLENFKKVEKNFFDESNNKYNEFLTQYKETNEKMINLIRKLTVSEGE